MQRCTESSSAALLATTLSVRVLQVTDIEAGVSHEGSNCAQLDLRSDLRSGLRFGRGWICGWVCGWASGVPAVGRGWVAVLLRFVVAVSLELQSENGK